MSWLNGYLTIRGEIIGGPEDGQLLQVTFHPTELTDDRRPPPIYECGPFTYRIEDYDATEETARFVDITPL